MADLFKNVITFGAAGRIESEQNSLSGEIRALGEVDAELGRRHALMEAAIGRLVEAKVAAVTSLGKLREIAENLSVRERQLAERSLAEGERFELQSFDMANVTLTAGEAAINAAKGLGAGASTALGAWALVATYGTASTGTAIASLSGAAATNATLAALGGGAVASGGGGMVAGTAVLGGLVVIPALIGLAAFSHLSANTKIKEMREHSLKIVEATEKQQRALLIINLAIPRAEELASATAAGQRAFLNEFDKVQRKLLPYGALSRFLRKLRKLFVGRYYSVSDLTEIAYIGQVASQLARIVDTKVFESDGSVTQGEST